jgi:signal transduction histidine kinase
VADYLLVATFQTPGKLVAVESVRSNSRSRVEGLTWVWQVLLLAALYAGAGRLGLILTNYQGDTLIWPPTGLSLAALILFGRHLWPGIFIGMLLVGLSSSLGWIPLVGIAIGNTLEAVVGVTLLIRVVDFRPNLARIRDGIAFLLIGVLGCTTIGSTIGTVSVLLSGNVEAADFGSVWLSWWLGTAGGALILTPAMLMLVHGAPSWKSLTRRLESWLVLAILLATSLYAFFGPDLGLMGLAASIAPFPVLVWTGVRLGPRGAVIASSVIILVATLATGTSSGPFVSGTPVEGMFLLWAYSMFIGLTAYTLAAVVEQRMVAEQGYRSEEAVRILSEKQELLLLERERLTREMHDGLGGHLVSALSMVERGMAAPNEIAEVLRRAIDDIRIVIDSLDPDATDLPTSLGKLRARLEPLLRRNGIELTWDVEDIPGLDAFPPESALHVLRIIQEAITNTLRHAHANNVEVRISGSGVGRRELHVSIHDDGRGLEAPVPSGGRGIKNMKSRAEELGAVLKIEGTPSGTRIDLTIPVPR